RGPVRAFARDWVDARRTPSSYLMPVIMVFLVISLLPFYLAKAVVLLMPPLAVLAILDGVITGRRVSRLAAERFPNENLRGLGWYAASRSIQMRRLRIPNPRLRPGDKDKV